MLVTIIRLVLLYALITLAIRLMGKRQVGELQPTELVVTIMLSELVAIPIQDNSLPMATSLVAVGMLVALEIFSSVIAVYCKKYRSLTQGNSITVIRKGNIDTRRLRDLRISLDDLLEALRQKDVFDVGEVETCIVETNGQLSVCKKEPFRPLQLRDLPGEKQA